MGADCGGAAMPALAARTGSSRYCPAMSAGVLTWWSLLLVVSALNLVAWGLSALALQRRRDRLDPSLLAARRAQLWLSAGYVLGCAFRSAFPVHDVPRTCLVDSWLSSVIVGRSVATVAELCFVAQWALMLREVARVAESRTARFAAAAVLPMILVAEACSWYAVLSTSNLGHVIEESLWGAAAVLLLASLVAVWPRCGAALRSLFAACGAAALAYAEYMFLVDVPMYWSRWLASESLGTGYLPLADGVVDVARRCVVSWRWEDWRAEMPWMTLYFSVGVWVSLALVHAPGLERRLSRRGRERIVAVRAAPRLSSSTAR